MIKVSKGLTELKHFMIEKKWVISILIRTNPRFWLFENIDFSLILTKIILKQLSLIALIKSKWKSFLKSFVWNQTMNKLMRQTRSKTSRSHIKTIFSILIVTVCLKCHYLCLLPLILSTIKLYHPIYNHNNLFQRSQGSESTNPDRWWNK